MAVIKLTNDVQLAQASVEGLPGIDVSDQKAHYINTNNSIIDQTYTATEDCWVVGNTGSNHEWIYINNVYVTQGFTMVPLKKGQTIKAALDGSRQTPYRDMWVYGTKK